MCAAAHPQSTNAPMCKSNFNPCKCVSGWASPAQQLPILDPWPSLGSGCKTISLTFILIQIWSVGLWQRWCVVSNVFNARTAAEGQRISDWTRSNMTHWTRSGEGGGGRGSKIHVYTAPKRLVRVMRGLHNTHSAI